MPLSVSMPFYNADLYAIIAVQAIYTYMQSLDLRTTLATTATALVAFASVTLQAPNLVQ